MYYERGCQPLLPINIVHTLQSAGIRGKDLAQVRVRKRVIF